MAGVAGDVWMEGIRVTKPLEGMLDLPCIPDADELRTPNLPRALQSS